MMTSTMLWVTLLVCAVACEAWVDQWYPPKRNPGNGFFSGYFRSVCRDDNPQCFRDRYNCVLPRVQRACRKTCNMCDAPMNNRRSLGSASYSPLSLRPNRHGGMRWGNDRYGRPVRSGGEIYGNNRYVSNRYGGNSAGGMLSTIMGRSAGLSTEGSCGVPSSIPYLSEHSMRILEYLNEKMNPNYEYTYEWNDFNAAHAQAKADQCFVPQECSSKMCKIFTQQTNCRGSEMYELGLMEKVWGMSDEEVLDHFISSTETSDTMQIWVSADMSNMFMSNNKAIFVGCGFSDCGGSEFSHVCIFTETNDQ